MFRLLHVGIAIRLWVADELLERGPNARVVGFGEVSYDVRGQRSDEMVGSRDRAVQQKQPRRLEVRDAWEELQEVLLVHEPLLQDAGDEFLQCFRRACRG